MTKKLVRLTNRPPPAPENMPTIREIGQKAGVRLSIDSKAEAELSAMLMNFVRLRADLPTFRSRAERYNSALQAASQLRAVLPELIARPAAYAEAPPKVLAADLDKLELDGLKKTYQGDALALTFLSVALESAFPSDTARVSVDSWVDDWHLYAAMLFLVLKRVTPHRARTREGIATKFIAAALQAIGYPHVTVAAVEHALQDPPRKWSGFPSTRSG